MMWWRSWILHWPLVWLQCGRSTVCRAVILDHFTFEVHYDWLDFRLRLLYGVRFSLSSLLFFLLSLLLLDLVLQFVNMSLWESQYGILICGKEYT